MTLLKYEKLNLIFTMTIIMKTKGKFCKERYGSWVLVGVIIFFDNLSHLYK